MEEHDRKTAGTRECRHFLLLTITVGKQELTLWARCRRCPRRWFIGSHAEVIAGLAKLEQVS